MRLGLIAWMVLPFLATKALAQNAAPVVTQLTNVAFSSAGAEDGADADSTSADPDSTAADPAAVDPDSTAVDPAAVTPDSTAVDPGSESFRSRVSRLISDQIFVRPGEVASDALTAQTAEETFRPYQGHKIRSIQIVRVGVFEYYDGTTARSRESFAGRIGDILHFDSRHVTIRKYFLMEVGDPLDAGSLADTQRLLRRTPFILDAKIEVLPSADVPGLVDVFVITRDRWSLGFDPKFKTSRRYDFDVEERNVVGLGHQLKFNFGVDLDLEQTVGFTGIYRTDNLQGTFAHGEYRYRDTHVDKSHRLLFARDRLAPQIQYIGALELEYAEQLPQTTLDSLVTLSRGDIWIGRAIPLGRSPLGGTSRTAITPAVRVQRINYDKRPSVTESLNRSFRDRSSWLGSVSLNRSRFRESRLILGYGRTEDIPYGFLVNVTGGAETDEFESRPYAGGQARLATYSDRFGYAFGGASLGGFVREGKWEDTALDLRTAYFSPLGGFSGFRFRNFLEVRFTRGTKRRTTNGLGLDSSHGLDAVDINDQRGDQRLIARFESVTFTPIQLLGFKFALFQFIGSGAVTPNHVPLARGGFTSTAGFGLRFHNERLILNPFELRFAFLLTAPEGTTINSFRFGSAPSANFPGLDPGAPSFVPFR